MTSLLTKSIYGYETDHKKTPFGFLNNQVRLDGIINNAGWFNFLGERLGFGDLSIQDMKNISLHIPVGEIFIILSEADSGWSLPSHLDQSAPGKDYVLQRAIWIIGKSPDKKELIIRVKENVSIPEQITKDGINYTRLDRNTFYKTLAYDPKAIPVAPTKVEPKKYTPDKIITTKKSTISSVNKSGNYYIPAVPTSGTIPASKSSWAPAKLRKPGKSP